MAAVTSTAEIRALGPGGILDVAVLLGACYCCMWPCGPVRRLTRAIERVDSDARQPPRLRRRCRGGTAVARGCVSVVAVPHDLNGKTGRMAITHVVAKDHAQAGERELLR